MTATSGIEPAGLTIALAAARAADQSTLDLAGLTRDQLLDALRWHTEWEEFTAPDRANGAPEILPCVVVSTLRATVDALLPAGTRWDIRTGTLYNDPGQPYTEISTAWLQDILTKATVLTMDLYPQIRDELTTSANEVKAGEGR